MKRIYAILISLAVVLALAVPPASATVVVMGNRGLAMTLAGLHSDSKPTSYAYGSTFYETDTGISYVYTGAGWVEDRRGGPNLTNLAAIVHGATSKATPVDADELALWDSAATALKKLTWTNLKAALKTYFDTLYCPVTSGSFILKGDGAGSTTAAVAGTDYAAPATSTSITSSATPTPAVGTAGAEIRYFITALATAPTFGAPTGTPVNGQLLWFRIKDDGTARTLSWNAAYAAVASLPLPTTTVISTTMYVAFRWNSTDSKWDLVGVR